MAVDFFSALRRAILSRPNHRAARLRAFAPLARLIHDRELRGAYLCATALAEIETGGRWLPLPKGASPILVSVPFVAWWEQNGDGSLTRPWLGPSDPLSVYPPHLRVGKGKDGTQRLFVPSRLRGYDGVFPTRWVRRTAGHPAFVRAISRYFSVGPCCRSLIYHSAAGPSAIRGLPLLINSVKQLIRDCDDPRSDLTTAERALALLIGQFVGRPALAFLDRDDIMPAVMAQTGGAPAFVKQYLSWPRNSPGLLPIASDVLKHYRSNP